MGNKVFKLLTRDNEVINKVKSKDIYKAIESFASIKKLSSEELLKIYKVEEKT